MKLETGPLEKSEAFLLSFQRLQVGRPAANPLEPHKNLSIDAVKQLYYN
jgi:hypothetical protein